MPQASPTITPDDHVNVLSQFLARAQLNGAEAPAFTQALGWLESVPAALQRGERAAAQLDQVLAEGADAPASSGEPAQGLG